MTTEVNGKGEELKRLIFNCCNLPIILRVERVDAQKGNL